MDTDREDILLAKLQSGAEDSEAIMLELVLLYERNHEPMKAIPYLQQLVSNTQDAEKVARYYLHMGQLMEQAKNYEAAVLLYLKALAMDPMDKRVAYFIRNNLGYCMNLLGRHKEAEELLAEAMKIDHTLPNAYKNFGVCWEAMGNSEGAAKFYMMAALANPFDPRALQHLFNLSLKYPKIHIDMNDFGEMVEARKRSMAAGQTLEEFLELRDKPADEV